MVHRCHPWQTRLLIVLLAVALTGCTTAASPVADVSSTEIAIKPTEAADSLAALAAPTARSIRVRASPPLPTAMTGSTATAPAATSTPPPTVASGDGPARVIEYGETGRREIALTFDAGADRGYGKEVLNLLAERGLKVSFGMKGVWAEANPDLLQRMVDEGHLLMNHTWDHPSFTGVTTETEPLSTAERITQMRETEALVRELTGYDLRPYFRPPYGDIDEQSLIEIASAGYSDVVLWSCDSRDSLGATGAEILANCIENAAPGRIVLLHLGGQSAAYGVLPEMIDTLSAAGFTFVTVDQMVSEAPPA